MSKDLEKFLEEIEGEKEEMEEARLDLSQGIELSMDVAQDEGDVADLVFADPNTGKEKTRLGIDYEMAEQFLEVLQKAVKKPRQGMKAMDKRVKAAEKKKQF